VSGVRPARLHDARHTAATFLLVQGVDQRVVMDMLGWTSPTMTARYQHVVPELVEEANRRMSELLWGSGT
jgi:integrase